VQSFFFSSSPKCPLLPCLLELYILCCWLGLYTTSCCICLLELTSSAAGWGCTPQTAAGLDCTLLTVAGWDCTPQTVAGWDCTSGTAASWGCTLYTTSCYYLLRGDIIVIYRKKDKLDRKGGKDSVVESRR